MTNPVTSSNYLRNSAHFRVVTLEARKECHSTMAYSETPLPNQPPLGGYGLSRVASTSRRSLSGCRRPSHRSGPRPLLTALCPSPAVKRSAEDDASNSTTANRRAPSPNLASPDCSEASFSQSRKARKVRKGKQRLLLRASLRPCPSTDG